MRRQGEKSIEGLPAHPVPSNAYRVDGSKGKAHQWLVQCGRPWSRGVGCAHAPVLRGRLTVHVRGSDRLAMLQSSSTHRISNDCGLYPVAWARLPDFCVDFNKSRQMPTCLGGAARYSGCHRAASAKSALKLCDAAPAF